MKMIQENQIKECGQRGLPKMVIGSIHTNPIQTNWSYSMSEFKSKRQELMTITMEECGELIQACSKAIRCGTYEKNDDLIQELCDVKCMIDLMIENKIITTMELTNGSNLKKLKLMKWSNLFGVVK